MYYNHEYPILEFDDSRTAKINPENMTDKESMFACNQLVITFFPEVIDKLIRDETVVKDRTIPGENPIDMYRFKDSDVLITLGQIGCPACAGNLELFHAMGVNKVMFCGGAGVLDKTIEVGQLLLVDGAIRDDGFSYHYFSADRVIYTDEKVTEKIADYLEQNQVSYLRGLTWTTDAIFRETADRITRRKAEGAKMVEMEQSGCIAVARFRGFEYGALIYGGDDVSQDEWNGRRWRSREGIRYDLVMLCRDLVRIL